MPLESMLFLFFVVGVFTLFGIVLAYGDWATRQAIRGNASLSSRPRQLAKDGDKPKDARIKAAA